MCGVVCMVCCVMLSNKHEGMFEGMVMNGSNCYICLGVVMIIVFGSWLITGEYISAKFERSE